MATKVERLLKKARTQLERGKEQKALGYYRDACNQAPYDPDVWVERANLAKKQGAGDEAVEALFHAADLYARSGLAREAAELASQVLDLDPKHGGAKRFVRLLKKRPEKNKPADNKPVVETATPIEQAKASFADEDDDLGPIIEMVAAPAADEEEPPPPIHLVAREAKVEPAVAGKPAVEEAAAMQARKVIASVPEPMPEAELAARIEAELAAQFEAELAAELEAELAAESAAPSARVIEPAPAVAIAEDVAPASPARIVATGNSWAASTPTEHEIGRTTGELALGELSLAELSDDSDEYPLDDESDLHIVHAVAATVAASPLLSELDSDLVKYLIEVGSLRRCAAGQSLFEQGQTGTSLFLILEGDVVVERASVDQTGDAKVKRLATLRRGAFFGEMALLTDEARSATVRATRDATLLEVSRAAIRKLVKREKRVLKLLMRFFRARLVGTMMATSPLFKPFSTAQRRELVTRFRLREFPSQFIVLEKGKKSDGLYVVLVGQLSVFIPDSRGDAEKVLGRLGPGDVFGEMSLLQGTTPSATVRTVARSWLLRLPRDVFSEVVAAHPNLLEQLVEISEARKQQNLETLTRVKPI